MKNISGDSLRALALSKRDQIIESFKRQKSQLKEIDEDGPKTKEDIDIIKMCVKFVMAEISNSEAEQMEIEKKL